MLSQTLKVAMKSIWAQKMRSLLTMLGVIIGVAAVIALIGLARGASASISSQIQGLGSNLIVIKTNQAPGAAALSASSAAAPLLPPGQLTPNEALSLGQVPGIAAVAPVMAGTATFGVGATSSAAGLVGTNASYQPVMNYQLAAGRFLSPLDIASDANVAVLGSQEATTLFGAADPVGNSMTIDGVPFQVIGVLAPKGSALGQSQDSFVAIPWSVAESVLGQTSISTIYLSARSSAAIAPLTTRLDLKLLTWLGSAANFSLTTQSQILSTLNSITTTMQMVLGGIAGISLVVGGIGIMNIMLVSVTERTREIGIRKAIGASYLAIMSQFLVESLTLSGLGGILGIGLGTAISEVLGHALGTVVAFSPTTALLAFAFSLGVGLIFGLWPASRAAGLHPVDALRID
ncbi:MAG: ABC transporter permease [Thermaerobacter sp.]|nr:ABC transporter permease [Thermaerobacter sp.]